MQSKRVYCIIQLNVWHILSLDYSYIRYQGFLVHHLHDVSHHNQWHPLFIYAQLESSPVFKYFIL